MSAEPDIAEIRDYVHGLAAAAPTQPELDSAGLIDQILEQNQSQAQGGSQWERRKWLPALAAAAIVVVAAGVYVLRPAHDAVPSATAGSHTSATVSDTRPTAVPSASLSPLPPLPTKPVGAPAGHAAHVTVWRLIAAHGTQLTIDVEGPGGGSCTLMGYVEVSETTESVTITPIVFGDTTGRPCVSVLSGINGTLTLHAPLGTRKLVHASTS